MTHTLKHMHIKTTIYMHKNKHKKNAQNTQKITKKHSCTHTPPERIHARQNAYTHIECLTKTNDQEGLTET